MLGCRGQSFLIILALSKVLAGRTHEVLELLDHVHLLFGDLDSSMIAIDKVSTGLEVAEGFQKVLNLQDGGDLEAIVLGSLLGLLF